MSETYELPASSHWWRVSVPILQWVLQHEPCALGVNADTSPGFMQVLPNTSLDAAGAEIRRLLEAGLIEGERVVNTVGVWLVYDVIVTPRGMRAIGEWPA